MGRTSSDLIPFLINGLEKNLYPTLKRQLSGVVIKLPRKSRTLSIDDQRLLKDWDNLKGRTYNFVRDYSDAKQRMKQAIKRSIYLKKILVSRHKIIIEFRRAHDWNSDLGSPQSIYSSTSDSSTISSNHDINSDMGSPLSSSSNDSDVLSPHFNERKSSLDNEMLLQVLNSDVGSLNRKDYFYEVSKTAPSEPPEEIFDVQETEKEENVEKYHKNEDEILDGVLDLEQSMENRSAVDSSKVSEINPLDFNTLMELDEVEMTSILPENVNDEDAGNKTASLNFDTEVKDSQCMWNYVEMNFLDTILQLRFEKQFYDIGQSLHEGIESSYVNSCKGMRLLMEPEIWHCLESYSLMKAQVVENNLFVFFKPILFQTKQS